MDETKLQSIILYLEQKGLKAIQVSNSNKKMGAREAQLTDELGYLPSITARHFESHYIYEIEDCVAMDTKLAIEKWRAFAEYTRKKRGRLCLIIPKEKESLIQKMLDENEIDASLLKMKNL